MQTAQIQSNSVRQHNLLVQTLLTIAITIFNVVLAAPVQYVEVKLTDMSQELRTWNSTAIQWSGSDHEYGFTNISQAQMALEAAILIPISLLVAGLLIGPALTSIYGTSTSGWQPAVVTVVQILLPTMAVLGIAIQYIYVLTHGGFQ